MPPLVNVAHTSRNRLANCKSGTVCPLKVASSGSDSRMRSHFFFRSVHWSLFSPNVYSATLCPDVAVSTGEESSGCRVQSVDMHRAFTFPRLRGSLQDSLSQKTDGNMPDRRVLLRGSIWLMTTLVSTSLHDPDGAPANGYPGSLLHCDLSFENDKS